MDYLAYHFTVNPPQPGSEILIALISDMGFDSFDYSDTGFVAYIREEDAKDLDLEALMFDDFSYSFEVEKIPAANWNSEWEKNFEPVFVDRLLAIRAPFHEKDLKVDREIVIMPKMSFGTGHHQTTRLVCRAMFETGFENKRVLDMGCGTGILAILAKMLGAADVLGIDIDAWSVENSVENCMVNGYPDIKIRKGDAKLLAGEAPFDIILANINKNILKRDLPFYSDKLKSGGRLFLSGFFITDADELKEAADKASLDFISTRREDEWAMMLFGKQ